MNFNLNRNREIDLTVFLIYFAEIIFFVSLLFSSCGKKVSINQTKKPLPDDIYSLEVLKDRKKKDLSLLTDANSPLKATDQEVFKGLNYYDPTHEFIFECVLRRYSSTKEFTIQTSKNKSRVMIHAGYFEFTYQNMPYRLQVFAPKDTSEDGMYYFVPFKDATNGAETYGGGRYLDFDNVKSDTLFLDFNYSYSPYCAYNEKYDCPIPPVENHLPITIRAGEKIFKASSH